MLLTGCRSVHPLLVLHAHGVGHLCRASKVALQLRPSATWTQSQIFAAGAATFLAQFGSTRGLASSFIGNSSNSASSAELDRGAVCMHSRRRQFKN